jgi:biopolymer transport protein ExbB/TolQ
MPTWLIWLIVIVVIVVVAALVVMLARTRRTAHRRTRAEELRQEASDHAARLPESQRETEELRAKADLAKAEAARAEERAANAEQSHRVEEAGYEDKVREADRLDPDVSHQADDYEPDVWNDERSETDPEAGPPAHR